mgnify:CR=1 FL=1
MKDNIIRDLKEVDYEGDWKTLDQNRVTWRAYVLAAMNFWVPQANELVSYKDIGPTLFYKNCMFNLSYCYITYI